MLEQMLQEMFERQTADLPQVQASIAKAAAQGRAYQARRRRRRRLVAIGTPFLAAAAVLAVAVTPTFSHRTPNPPAPAGKSHHQRPAHSLPAAPREFNPLVPYATFGWLPAGTRYTATSESHTVAFLTTVGAHHALWQLAMFARGDCALAGAHLNCRDLTASQEPTATRSAPKVDGFPAYWDYPSMLIFEYARGGWATLSVPGRNGEPDAAGRATAVHIATALRVSSANVLPARFPAQLAGLPGGWAVRAVMTSPSRYGPLEFQYQIARGSLVLAPWSDPNDIPNLSIGPANKNTPACYVTPGLSQRQTVAGRLVTVTRIPAEGTESATQDLCASNVDGLAVDIVTTGDHPGIDVTTLFADLRLLGPDPAHWTRKPIG
jgi:hypothetical protein